MDLTARQKSVFDVICEYHRQNGFSPTVREICQRLGLSGPAGVHRILGVLAEKGYIRSSTGKNRSWRPVEAVTNTMPVAGRIAAGEPLDVWDNPEERIPVNPELYGNADCFALRVVGDSMDGDHILDGDLAIIRPQPDVVDDRIAAVVVEGLIYEATLKKVRKLRSMLELHSSNPAYSAIRFAQNKRKKVQIIGQYVGLIRRVTYR